MKLNDDGMIEFESFQVTCNGCNSKNIQFVIDDDRGHGSEETGAFGSCYISFRCRECGKQELFYSVDA